MTPGALMKLARQTVSSDVAGTFQRASQSIHDLEEREREPYLRLVCQLLEEKIQTVIHDHVRFLAREWKIMEYK